jgi:ABC-2 type transport system ATP-binding protein
MAKSKTKKSLPVKPTSKQTNTKKQPKVSFIKKLFPPQYFTKDIAEYGKMTRKPVLFVRNLTKKYSRRKAPAIENVNINVYPGEFHAFIGANGAGKTTTLKSIIGGYVNWSGTILINGINSNKEAAKAKLGYIPETPRFPAQFSAFQYLEIMMELSGVSPKDAKIRTEKELKSMNL